MKNVILITSDHMRRDALRCYGNDFVKTPNLDALAHRGVTFWNAFTPNPVCVPARAAITTGNYPHKATGRKTNAGEISDDQPKIAEHFGAAGYRTLAVGKLHYVPYAPPDEPRLLHGFQHAELTEEGRIIAQFDPKGASKGLEDYHDYLHEVGWGGFGRAHGIGNNDIHPAPSPLPAEHFVDSWVASRSVRLLEQHTKEERNRPFFLWASFTKPHSPYDPPRPYDELYDPRTLPSPVGDSTMLVEKSPLLSRARDQHGWKYLSPEAFAVARAHYFGLVTFQDQMIGQLLASLDRLGLSEETVIVYTADHGDLLGDFGCWFKGNHLNGSVRVPLIVSDPTTLPMGEKRYELAGLHDILPTVSALAGVPFNHQVDGENLSLACTGGPWKREFIVSQHQESPYQTSMVFDGAWKYIYTELGGYEELYDIEHDPNELHNLALKAGGKEQCLAMRSRLIEWCKKHGDNQLLDGDDLAHSAISPEPSEFRTNAMGWRWY